MLLHDWCSVPPTELVVRPEGAKLTFASAHKDPDVRLEQCSRRVGDVHKLGRSPSARVALSCSAYSRHAVDTRLRTRHTQTRVFWGVAGPKQGKTMSQALRVLIADDSAPARCGLRALLITWPEVEVVGVATNGHEAVRLVEEHQPDVVLMDLQMPVMGGLQATRLIKKQWPAVSVVVLTTYATQHAAALAAGADIFLLKGGPPGRLFAALSSVGAGREA